MGRALIVDDDPSFRLGLAAVLRLEGFVTATAATCREALDELARGSVDVLFVDVNLPDGSGFDLLPRPDAASVIVVTAEPSLSVADEALSLGAWDCLAKPVERMRVRMTLASLARERRMREEINRLRDELASLAGEGQRP
ncbi:MAG TPA: response regulator [Vicinamibacteria bacterium]|nr:response regulator [Vicinamibacteria bacterium]